MAAGIDNNSNTSGYSDSANSSDVGVLVTFVSDPDFRRFARGTSVPNVDVVLSCGEIDTR
jgi:hypothetical protein